LGIFLSQHRIKGHLSRCIRNKAFNTPDPKDPHVLGDFYRIGTPGSDHRCPGADKEPLDLQRIKMWLIAK